MSNKVDCAEIEILINNVESTLGNIKDIIKRIKERDN